MNFQNKSTTLLGNASPNGELQLGWKDQGAELGVWFTLMIGDFMK